MELCILKKVDQTSRSVWIQEYVLVHLRQQRYFIVLNDVLFDAVFL